MKGEAIIGRLLGATLPLSIWAAHFFGAYLLVAAQCSPALITPAMPSRLPLAALTLMALAACAILSWRSRKPSGLYGWARLGSCVLALIGIVFSSVPLILLGDCR